MQCCQAPFLRTDGDQVEVGGDSRVEEQIGAALSIMLIRRSMLAGHRRPLLCRGVAHNVADRATGSVPEEEEAIAGPPETDLANAGQLPQKGE